MNNSEQTFPTKPLKPCPFCGKPVSAIEVEMLNEGGNLRAIGLVVECYSCAVEIKIDTKYRREDAIDVWNRRAEEI